MLPLDLNRYHHGSSRIHRLDPRTKLLATLSFIIVAALLPGGSWLSYGLLFGATLLVAAASGLGTGFALRRSFVALPFALAAVTLPFTVAGQPVANIGPLTVTLEGLVRFVSLLLKSWLSVQAAILLVATTPFPMLLWGLRALGVPTVLVSIVSFMYRYLFVISDEATRLIRARAARAATGTVRVRKSLVWHGKVAGGMVGNLGLRSFERSERIHAAMVARGFRGELRVFAPPKPADADYMSLVGWISFLAMALLIGMVF